MLPSLIGQPLLDTLAQMARQPPPGAFVEIGVYQGGSASVLYDIAQEQGRAIYLYDTFSGMPVSGPLDSHQIGEFGDCSADDVRRALPKAQVVEGIFPYSIIPMMPIAFAHIDCDQFESVRAACEIMPPLMVKGGSMLFDDYRGLQGCIAAVDAAFPDAEILPDQRALVKIT